VFAALFLACVMACGQASHAYDPKNPADVATAAAARAQMDKAAAALEAWDIDGYMAVVHPDAEHAKKTRETLTKTMRKNKSPVKVYVIAWKPQTIGPGCLMVECTVRVVPKGVTRAPCETNTEEYFRSHDGEWKLWETRYLGAKLFDTPTTEGRTFTGDEFVRQIDRTLKPPALDRLKAWWVRLKAWWVGEKKPSPQQPGSP